MWCSCTLASIPPLCPHLPTSLCAFPLAHTTPPPTYSHSHSNNKHRACPLALVHLAFFLPLVLETLLALTHTLSLHTQITTPPTNTGHVDWLWHWLSSTLGRRRLNQDHHWPVWCKRLITAAQGGELQQHHSTGVCVLVWWSKCSCAPVLVWSVLCLTWAVWRQLLHL